MKHVSLGGLDVSRIGLGAMTMAGVYTVWVTNLVTAAVYVDRSARGRQSRPDERDVVGPSASDAQQGLGPS